MLKLSITVELLLGEIPERQVFLHKDNKEALAPYMQLTQGKFILKTSVFIVIFVFAK